MEFRISEEGKIIEDQVVRFIDEKIIPAERVITEEAQDTPNGKDTPTMALHGRRRRRCVGRSAASMPRFPIGSQVS